MVNEWAESKQLLAGFSALQACDTSCVWRRKSVIVSIHGKPSVCSFSMPPGRTGFLVSNLLNFSLKDPFCSETKTKISILRVYAGHALAPVLSDFIQPNLQNIFGFQRSQGGTWALWLNYVKLSSKAPHPAFLQDSVYKIWQSLILTLG